MNYTRSKLRGIDRLTSNCTEQPAQLQSILTERSKLRGIHPYTESEKTCHYWQVLLPAVFYGG